MAPILKWKVNKGCVLSGWTKLWWGQRKKIEGHSQQPAANSGEDEGDLDDAEMKKNIYHL